MFPHITPCCSLRLVWSCEAVDQDALFGELLTDCGELAFAPGLRNKRCARLTEFILALLKLTQECGALLLQLLDVCIATPVRSLSCLPSLNLNTLNH